jgi:hypothetical protein
MKEEELAMSDEAKIETKLVSHPSQIPYGCTVCGGGLGWPCVYAATDADENIVVCGDCLRDGKIDSTLTQTAEGLEQRAKGTLTYAAYLRSLIGRLKVPTFAEWEAAEKRERLLEPISKLLGGVDRL